MRISQLPVAFATVTLAVALASAGSAVASAATIRPVQGDRHVCAATAAPGHAECLALIPADPPGPATPRRPGSAPPGGSSRRALSPLGAASSGVTSSGAISPGAAPFALTGYEPADLQRAYNLAAAAASAGAGQTVAVVDAFDDPTALPPQRQIMVAERIAWVGALAAVPARSAEEEAASAARYPAVVSRQHPDHDTEAWPPAG